MNHMWSDPATFAPVVERDLKDHVINMDSDGVHAGHPEIAAIAEVLRQTQKLLIRFFHE